MEKLDKLHLMYNNISKYNEQALWTHPELTGLGLLKNSIQMPAGKIHMRSLNFLSWGKQYCFDQNLWNRRDAKFAVSLLKW